MKQLIICALLIVISISVFSQKAHPKHTFTANDYHKKSKFQSAAGAIVLSGGLIMIAMGGVNALENSITGDETDPILPLLGLGVAIGSIPLLTSAGENKRRAVSLSLQTHSIFLPQHEGLKFTNPPALTFRIGL